MNPLFLIKLSQSDKRILLILLVIFILIIIIVGYLQKLVAFLMRRQGLMVDTMMYDIIRSGVIKSKKEFKREAYRKSMVLFVNKAWWSFLLIIVSVGAILIYGAARGNMSFFSEALSQLSIHLYWPTSNFFGLNIVSDWPSVSSWPDFSWNGDKYFALLFFIILLVACAFYFYQVMSYLSRCLRIRQLSRTYFSKDLNKLNNQNMTIQQ